MNICLIIDNLPKYKEFRTTYINMVDFERQIQNNNVEFEDYLSLTPFYLTKGAMIELYDYELNILVENNLNTEQYILQKIFRNTTDQIPMEVKGKLMRCNISISEYDNKRLKKFLKDYLIYLFDSDDIKMRVNSQVGLFDRNNLYFELW